MKNTDESSSGTQLATRLGITPCLWFNSQAEEAVDFYISVFSSAGRDSKITGTSRYGEASAQASGMPEGSVMTISFQIDGQAFLALNGGPHFTATPAISFIVNCQTQEDVDAFWENLSEGGEVQRCGWLQDKYGVSWQVVPTALGEMMRDADAERIERVMRAMLQMKKPDIGELKRAYEGN